MARTRTARRTLPLARRALDRRLTPLRDSAHLAAVPHAGWIRALREALGMSAAELGARIGTVESTVLRMEHSEAASRIGLDTLRRAADALECDLIYALVPRRPLAVMVDHQARTLAGEHLDRVAHTMALENQQPRPEALAELLEDLVAQVRDRPGLWRQDP